MGSWGDNSYSWDDVSFVIEIVGGLGTGRRRSKEARLNQLDKDKKKRLIRLICRVKGELVYDEEKEVGDVHIKLEKHLAVSDERWKETILRIKRMEHIMIATSGTAIIMLIGLLVR